MTRPPDVSVVSSGHDVADARLHRVVMACQEAGLSVEVIGLGDPAGAPAGCAVRTWSRPSIWRRPLLAARVVGSARGRALIALDPDSLVAARLRWAGRRLLVADVHEDYARLLHDRAWSRGLAKRIALGLTEVATRVASRADVTIVADASLPPLRAARRLVVPNHPLHWPGATLDPLDEEPRAAYVGDLRSSRGLFRMLEVIEGLPDWTLDLIGPVREADRAELEQRLAGDLGSRVRWHGRQPPDAAWSIASGAWAGFALLDDTPAFRRAVPSKIYEYLAWGMLPVASDLPRQRAFLQEAGAGVCVRDVAHARTVLDDLAGDPDRVRHLRDVGAQFAGREMGDCAAYQEAAAAIAALVRGES